jgi:hypothetical protein
VYLGGGTVAELLAEMAELPPDATIFSDEYEVKARWYRDMTDEEYRREVARRKKVKDDRALADRKRLDALAKKLGVTVVEGES